MINVSNAGNTSFSTPQPLNTNQTSAPSSSDQNVNNTQDPSTSIRSNNGVQQPVAPTQNVDLSKGWSNIYDIEFIYTPTVGFTGDPGLKLCYGENKCIQMDTSYKVIIPKGTFKALPYQGDEHHNADGSVKGLASDGKGLTYLPITPPKPGIGISISCALPRYQGGASLGDPTLRKIVFSPSQNEFLPFLQQEKGKVIDSVTEREVNSDGTSSLLPDPSNPNPVRGFSPVHFVY